MFEWLTKTKTITCTCQFCNCTETNKATWNKFCEDWRHTNLTTFFNDIECYKCYTATQQLPYDLFTARNKKIISVREFVLIRDGLMNEIKKKDEKEWIKKYSVLIKSIHKQKKEWIKKYVKSGIDKKK